MALISYRTTTQKYRVLVRCGCCTELTQVSGRVWVPAPVPAHGYFCKGIPVPRGFLHRCTEPTEVMVTAMAIVQNAQKWGRGTTRVITRVIPVEYPTQGGAKNKTNSSQYKPLLWCVLTLLRLPPLHGTTALFLRQLALPKQKCLCRSSFVFIWTV